MPEDRRLAAIMFTDIVGYTALMGSDEDKAFQLLRKNRDLQRPLIKKYRGKWLKEMGDGILASFHTASDAVRCAGEIQNKAKKAGIPLRIGIHEGEVVFEGGDVLGDGVNVASRLEELAEEGCINISGAVYKDIKNKAGIEVEFVEDKTLKNVDEPVKVYKVHCEVKEESQKALPEKTSNRRIYYIISGILILIVAFLSIWFIYPKQQHGAENELDKSIAILPFKNLSPEKENQYLADGVMDAITNYLAKIQDLRVIARTSTEVYRDRPKDIREIGREVGVNYLLEGSFQKYANNARLIIQLINAKDGSHIWSNEYDRDWSDIFKVQSDVAQKIAIEIKVVLNPEEIQDIQSMPTSDLTAYDYFLRGQEYYNRSFQEADFRYATQMYEQAIEIDSSFTLAWVGLAASSRFLYWFYFDRSNEHLQNTKNYLDKAIETDPNSLEVKLEEAIYYYQCEREYNKAIQILDRLKVKYQNNAEVFFWLGVVHKRLGEFNKSVDYFNQAIKLNPISWRFWNDLGHVLEFIGHYNEAEECFKKIIDVNPSIQLPYWMLIELYYLNGDMNKLSDLLSNSDIPLDTNSIKAETAYMHGNYDYAIRLWESFPDYVANAQTHFNSIHYTLGLLYYLNSNNKMMAKHFEAEREFLEDKLKDSNNDDRVYRSLGIVYAGLGNRTKAIEYGKKANELLGLKNDAFSGIHSEINMVRILMMLGEYDEAISRLEKILNYTGNISIDYLKNSYIWKPFHKNEKFAQLLSNENYQVKKIHE